MSVNNLTHIRFGLMERHRQLRRDHAIAGSMQIMTGAPFPEDERTQFLQGHCKIKLVRSGLEDVMLNAWSRISETHHDHGMAQDYRAAAYNVAIDKTV